MLQSTGDKCPVQNVFSVILFILPENAVIIPQEGVMFAATRTPANIAIHNDPSVDAE
jgi:hypothetical protein